MSRGMPSMMALLGLLAVAGYQNRDKIADALGGLGRQNGMQPGQGGAGAGGLGGILAGLGDLFGGQSSTGAGNTITGGLNDLIDRFKTSGQAETADSWTNMAVPTRGLTPAQVEQAVGADNLAELSERTGLTRDELLQRLATAIPETVDRLTPGGRMPSEEEARAQLLR